MRRHRVPYKPWPRGCRPPSARQVAEERRAAGAAAAWCLAIGVGLLVVVSVDIPSVMFLDEDASEVWLRETIRHEVEVEVERTSPRCETPQQKQKRIEATERRVRARFGP